MASTEWGPNKVSSQDKKLLEVTRFSGGQLKDIEEKFTSKINESPELSRDGAVFFLTLTEKDKGAKRMQLGLDILNQLSVLGKNGSDIRSIIVRQATNTNIESNEAENKRSGEGGPHYFSEIDWINPPIEKPISIPVKPIPKVLEKPYYPFKTAAQREAEMSLGERRRRAQIEHNKLEEATIKEREEITNIIIDTVRENVDQSIKYDLIKIEKDGNSTAEIYYKKSLGSNYVLVDRQTGELKKSSSDARTENINDPYFKYLQFLAEQAEGKEVVYMPEQLKPEAYEDIYQRALKVDMLKKVTDSEKGVIFRFKDYDSIFSSILIFLDGSDMDLEKNSVRVGDRERPINPHFAQFLKQKALAM